MSIFDLLAEERIRGALARGELSGLPGEGRPLDLDEDPLIPAEVRMSNRILRNAGGCPSAVLALKALVSSGAEADAAHLTPAQRTQENLRLLALVQNLEAQGLGRVAAALLARRASPPSAPDAPSV